MGNFGSSVSTISEDKNEDEKSPNDDFKFEMYEKRREILDAKKKQFEDLREEVRKLKEENELLKSRTLPEGFDEIIHENATLKGELKDKIEQLNITATLVETNRELKMSIAEMQEELQNLNTIVVDFEQERDEYKTHVIALKDVIRVSKKMLLIREAQLKELREKVESIEESLSGKEMNILSQDLRLEYERQLQSIRNLRTLYEERQRTDHKEKEELKKVIDETKKELEDETKKNKESEERISELEELNSQKYDEIKSLESNLGLARAESRQHQAELTVINQLFSEILLGFNSSQEINLDMLTKHLEDNHALLRNIVSDESSAALPKVLLDLVHQVHNEKEKKLSVNDGKRLETIIEETESTSDQINSVEEIVELLPKVWRVLIELLSHHKVPENVIREEDSTDDHPCYKTVQTPKGPSLVLSVSQTFIRLKDLILEKKSLEKETSHLKQLNTHLETRLQDQEKRLSTVSNELNKTWHVVGKLQKEHQLLHTQEKILRYELAQKRKLLASLRDELQCSREKWQEAREKNSKTEKQWKQLRIEFAARRNTLTSDDFNNSQESGYSDERCTSSSDEEADDSVLLVNSVIEEAEATILQQNQPSTSGTQKTKSLEEVLAAKEERLKRLEGQCGELMEQVTNTTQKSVMISNKLDNLHEAYGGGGNPEAEDVQEEDQE